jgi:hypothetical protein
VWDVETQTIPAHLRNIGSRFTTRCANLAREELYDPDAVRKPRNSIEFLELDEVNDEMSSP